MKKNYGKKNSYSKILLRWLESKRDEIKEQSYVKYFNFINLYISPYLGSKNYKRIKNKHIISFFEQEKIEELSLSTKRTLAFIIKSSFNYCTVNKLRKYLDLTDLKIKKPKSKVVYLTKNEQAKLENYLKDKKDIRKLGVLICLYTGIRLGEICGLKWKDIDFNAKSLSINRTVQRIKNNDKNAKTKTKKIVSTPKSNSSIRIIPLPTFLLKELSKYKSTPENYVLTNSTVFKDARVYEKYFENALKKCNIRNLNFHTLRHTFATRCIESGMDIKTLSELLGHSSYHVTLSVYVHSTIDQKRHCINKLVSYIKNK